MFPLPAFPVMRPPFKAASWAVATALVIPASVPAQTLDGLIMASGGVNAVRNGSQRVPGFLGELGLEMRRGDSRGAFRMGFMHYGQSRTDPYTPCDDWRRCTLSTRYSATGMKVEGTFDLTRGRVRPYVSSGVGVYGSRTVTRGAYTCSAGCTEPMFAWQEPKESFAASAGLHTGVGVAGKLGKTPVFTELRMLVLSTDGTQPRGLLPITLGVKF